MIGAFGSIFDQIKGNLAEIQPKNHQNVQEMPFSQEAPGVNGLKITYKNKKAKRTFE